MEQQNRPVSTARQRAAAKRKRRQKIMRNRIIFACVCLALLFLVVTLLRGLGTLIGNLTEGGSESQSQSQSQSEPVSEPETSLPAIDLTDWRLTLVNNNVAVPEGYEASLSVKVAESSTGKELAEEAADAYVSMKAAAAADGIDLLLCSGYRSVSYQEGLFANEKQEWLDKGLTEQEAYDKAKTIVAVPGYSEHNLGLAADIVTPSYQNLDEGFENTDAFKWLDEHCTEYGFILRYPNGKQDITGIIYEPWHYRYVGVENAAIIAESGLCLEEFLGQYQT
ncbi:MAG: M15 family metallopeptidase [Oscillospiraceae bacterium]|nr:M15 family metallopeptidase [Oscillospiraceae bacterium]